MPIPFIRQVPAGAVAISATVAIMTLMPLVPWQPAIAQTSALPSAVSACMANPEICAIVVITGGVLLYWETESRPIFIPVPEEMRRLLRQPVRPPAQPSVRQQLIPGEVYTRQYDVEEVVQARSLKEAFQECQKLAERLSRQTGTSHTLWNVKKTLKGGYICQINRG